jgi:hypothetical protein
MVIQIAIRKVQIRWVVSGVPDFFGFTTNRTACRSRRALAGLRVRFAPSGCAVDAGYTTLNVYTHAIPESQRRAVDKIAEILLPSVRGFSRRFQPHDVN